MIKKETGHNKVRSSNISPVDYNKYCIQSVANIMSAVPHDEHQAMEYLQNGNYASNSVKFNWEIITTEEVMNSINSLSLSRSQDAYGLSNYFVKNTIYVYFTPLTMLFNLCLLQGIFPKCLKISRVTPIHKKGDLKDLKNYRPICSVPIISKIFEIIISKQLVAYLEYQNILSPMQFGFR